jgi:8-oxo-dGTP diphosphatase
MLYFDLIHKSILLNEAVALFPAYIIELYTKFTGPSSLPEEHVILYKYRHPRPAVTVDIAIFMPKEDNYQILLIRRASGPFQGSYALPGGFCEMNESLEEAAVRELQEETGLQDITLTQIHTFSEPDRDPRGRIISTCYAGMLSNLAGQKLQAASDAEECEWFSLDKLPEMAFDHRLIIQVAAEAYLPG